MNASLQYFIPFVVCFFQLHLILGSSHEKQCEDPEKSSELKFMKQPSDNEYTAVSQSHFIHCCAAGYDIIEWYANDTRITYETSKKTSFTLIHGRQDNMTIKSDSVRRTDHGNYTCIVKNSTFFISTSFNVFTQVMLHKPEKPDIIQPSEETVCGEINETISIPCDANIGNELLGDTNIGWLKQDLSEERYLINDNEYIQLEPKGCIPSVSNDIQSDNTDRPGNISCTLNVTLLSEEQYGKYTCIVTFPPYEKEPRNDTRIVYIEKGTGCKPKADKWYEEYTAVIVCLVIFTILFVTISVIIYKKKLEILLWWRQHFGKLEDHDNKTYDVFICYDHDNATFVLNVLVPVLEIYYGYSCFVYDRDSLGGELLPEKFSIGLRDSRRFLMVLSGSFVSNVWCIYSVYTAVKKVLENDSKIICVILEDISWTKLEMKDKTRYERLKSILKVLKKVYWRAEYRTNDMHSKFWKSLVVNLPPKRNKRVNSITMKSIDTHL